MVVECGSYTLIISADDLQLHPCAASRMPNRRLEPTALLWHFARRVEPAAVVSGGGVLPVSGGGSRASR